jgi:hypothetical protein
MICDIFVKKNSICAILLKIPKIFVQKVEKHKKVLTECGKYDILYITTEEMTKQKIK